MSAPNDGFPSLLLDRPDEIRALRKVLEDAGFNHKDVIEVLGEDGVSAFGDKDMMVCAWRTREKTALNALIRMFILEAPVPIDSARQLLSPGTVALLTDAGLAAVRDGQMTASMKLLPYESFLFSFDIRRKLLSDASQDYVMGLGKSTMMLSNMTVRRPSRLTLDLGSGGGFQAIMASRHSEHVIASDLNPRAVRIAKFNAALNGLDNLECVEGDLFRPVEGRLFDLVVSNPPFVISPERKYTYRDSGLPGDEVCRKIVRGVPAVLAEGGICQILCNWAVRKGEDWRERLKEWFSDTGCDAWILGADSNEASVYASTWIRHTELRETGNYARQFEEWMEYYEGIGIDKVWFGIILMRKRTGGTSWYHAEVAPEKILGECGDDVLRGFAFRDFLEEAKSDEEILDRKYVPSPNLSIDGGHVLEQGGWVERTPRVRLSKGIAHEGDIDPIVAAVITRCDGEAPLLRILQEVAQRFSIDPAVLASPTCQVVRTLVERGFLWPATIGRDGLPLRQSSKPG
jgi:SAM-dependent methyltransferase